MAKPPRIIGYWLNDMELAELCRRRADQLSITYAEIDRLAGISPNHTGKVLTMPQEQGFGPVSRFVIPWALRMKFACVEAPEFTRDYTPRHDRAVRRGKSHGAIAKRLSIVEDFAKTNGKKGGFARLEKMTAAQRSAVARKAAKTRWRKYRDKLRAARSNPALTRQLQI